jgi:hypothetical protein
MFAAAVPVQAQSIGAAFKAGVQTLQHPLTWEQTTRGRFEIELSGNPAGSDIVDVVFAFGWSALGSFSDTSVTYDSIGTIQETLSDKLRLYDIRVAARLYPLGGARGYDDLPIVPYVGCGLGYFWMVDSWRDMYTETEQDPFDPWTEYVYTESEHGSKTLGKGLFLFVTAGFNIPFGYGSALLFEVQYDFSKKDFDTDFGGPIYIIGCRFRF